MAVELTKAQAKGVQARSVDIKVPGDMSRDDQMRDMFRAIIDELVSIRQDIAKTDKLFEQTQAQILRASGYTAMTGTADRAATLATGSVTVANLAQRVKAIQDDLMSGKFLST